jgi:hypothetical protein
MPQDALEPDETALSQGADLEPLKQQAGQSLTGARQRMEQTQQERGGMMKQFEQGMQGYQQAARARPQPPNMPQAPDNSISMGAAGTWLAAATVLGGIAGAMTRRHATNALAAFTGALQGVKEGNQIKFQQDSQKWEQENKAAYQNWKMAHDSYMETLEDKRLDQEMKMKMIDLKARQFSDDAMIAQASSGELFRIAALEDARAREVQKAMQAKATLDEARRHHGEQEKNAAGVPLTPEAKQMVADRDKAGDPSAKSNLGRGPAGQRAVADVINLEAAQGTKGADLAIKRAEFSGQQKGQGTLATREANLGLLANEARNAIPLALKNSTSTDRGGTVIWNQAQGTWDVQTGSKEWAAHVASTNALINLYARASNGGTWTVAGAEHARGILNPQMPPEAYNSAVKTIAQELNNFLKAPAQTRQQLETGKVEPIDVENLEGGGQQFTGKTIINRKTGHRLRETTDGKWVE